MKNKHIQSFLNHNQINDYEIINLVEEGSQRNYYRIFSKNQNKTYVLCITDPFIPERDDFLELNIFLKNNDLKIPSILSYFSTEGLILIEDGGNIFLQDIVLDLKKKENVSQIQKYYIKVIEELQKWHALKEIPEFVRNRFFDFTKLDFEMNFLYERLKKLNDIPQPPFELQGFMKEVNEYLSSQKEWVFSHRDFHSRNILYPKKEIYDHFYIIDYQDARMGLPWYDLSSLLFDPYVFLDYKEIHFLFDYYYKIHPFSTKDKEHYRNIFYLQALQRLLKALGSFFYLGLEKTKKHFLQSIPYTIEHLINVSILGKFPDILYLYFEDLKKAVKKYEFV